MPLAIELAAARASARCRSTRSPRGWATASTCSPAAAAPRARASRRCGRRIEWSHDLLDRRGAASSSAAWRCSPAASRWRRPRTSAPAARIARREIVDLLAPAGRQVARQSRADAALPPARHHPPVRARAPRGIGRARRPSPCATSTGAWRWPRSTTRSRPAARRSLRTLEVEHDNLRAALAFALRRDPQAALRLATSLWRFWLDRGYFAEGDRWLDAALLAAPERTPLRVEALLACAGLSLRSGDAELYLRRVAGRRARRTASWATSTRPLRRSTSTRCRAVGQQHRACGRALRRRDRLARRLGDRAAASRAATRRVGHDAVVPRRPRAGPRGPRRGARRSSRRSPTTTRRSSIA